MAGIVTALLLMLVGFALAFGGFLFFRTGLYLLGLLLGLSVGAAALSAPDLGLLPGLVLLVVCPLVGVALAVVLRLLLVASVGAGVGWLVGIALAGTTMVPSTSEGLLVAGGLAVVGIVAAYFLETAIVVLVSASWGSFLVALAVASGASSVVSEPELVLTGFVAVRLPVFLLGLAAQTGLWYYLRTHLDDDQDAAQFLLRRAGRFVGSVREGSSAGTGQQSQQPRSQPRGTQQGHPRSGQQGQRGGQQGQGGGQQSGSGQPSGGSGGYDPDTPGNPGPNEPGRRGNPGSGDPGGRGNPGSGDPGERGNPGRDDPDGRDARDGGRR